MTVSVVVLLVVMVLVGDGKNKRERKEKEMDNIRKILGVISIILGIILIILTWQYPFMGLGYMSFGGVDHILKGILGIFIYILVTVGFIASGIGIFKQKKWAIILFIILVIFWSILLFVTR